MATYRLFIVLPLVVNCWLALAAQPPRFNYQARLTDSSGAPLNSAHTLFFRLFQGGDGPTANSGTKVFEETAALTIVDGVVNHTVGTGNGQTFGPLTSQMLRTDHEIFLQVEMDSAGNFVLPRTRLESVPFSLLSADGDPRTAIGQPGSFPIVINQPGSYYLTGNINGISGQDGIDVTTSSVSLDLSGYTLFGAAGAVKSAIQITSGVTHVVIRNGAISGWSGDGIGVVNAFSTDMHIERIVASGCGRDGIEAGNKATVENCSSSGNGLTGKVGGIFVGDNSIVRNCVCADNVPIVVNLVSGIYTGSDCLIEGCICRGSLSFGSNGGAGITVNANCRIFNNICENNQGGAGNTTSLGITANGGCLISGNICRNNSGNLGGTNSSGIGIRVGDGSFIHDNYCSNNDGRGSGVAVGIQATGRCRIENNHCESHSGTTSHNFGIQVNSISSVGSSIIRNTTTSNTNAGLRFENTSGANYFAENVFNETTTVSQAAGGANIAGTGDRSNVSF